MALRRLVITGAPHGDDKTHESCFHTFPVLSQAQVMRIENADVGRQLRDAASRRYARVSSLLATNT